MAGIVHAELAQVMSCFYRDGVFVCQTRQGRATTGAAAEEGQALAAQLLDREAAKLRLADALTAGGMGADLEGHGQSPPRPLPPRPSQLGYEEPPQPGGLLDNARRPAAGHGMQIAAMSPPQRSVASAPGASPLGGISDDGRLRPSVPRVASLTYGAA